MLRILTVPIAAITLVAFVSGASTPPVDDDAAVRAALNSYLATVAYPDPKPIDPTLFATEIDAFWSNGETYRGRSAVVKALNIGVREVAAEFGTFAVKAEDVNVHRQGNLAWVVCRIDLAGTLTEQRGTFHRTIRSTFVFEKGEERWQMVHEHSSRLSQHVDKPVAGPKEQSE